MLSMFRGYSVCDIGTLFLYYTDLRIIRKRSDPLLAAKASSTFLEVVAWHHYLFKKGQRSHVYKRRLWEPYLWAEEMQKMAVFQCGPSAFICSQIVWLPFSIPGLTNGSLKYSPHAKFHAKSTSFLPIHYQALYRLWRGPPCHSRLGPPCRCRLPDPLVSVVNNPSLS